MITFPNTMHAYNAPEENAYYSMIICHPRLFGDYLNDLMHSAPSSPVIRAPFLHKDIPYAINRLTEEQQSDAASHGVCRALIQLILARAMPLLKLEERPSPGALDPLEYVLALVLALLGAGLYRSRDRSLSNEAREAEMFGDLLSRR